MTDQSSLGRTDNNVILTSVPVIIQLDDSAEENVQVQETETTSVLSTSINVPPQPPTVFCVPPPVVVEKIGKSDNSYGKGSGTKLGPPVVAAKSLLGADLFQKSASLAMPPPSSTSVKKARNLVSPGMSMVKWMKLQETRVRPPTRKKISLAEIAKHNSESDCWMVIRNCVYDVTEYLPYHPGGIPELMKGAGKDATALFNEVHRWVNFDSILRSCLQGYLQIEVGESFDEEDDEYSGPTSLVPSGNRLVTLPETKFSQTDSDLILQVDTKYNDELSDENWCVSILNRERLLLKVILKPPELWMAHVKLLQSLNDDSLSVNFQNSFKRAVITIRKPSTGSWKRLGSPMDDNNKLMDSRNSSGDDFSIGTIVEKENLTHNVILLGVEVNSSSFIGVPVGFHLKIRLVDGNGPARKYTPVIKSIIEDNACSTSTTTSSQIVVAKSEHNRKIYFIIKIYPDGQLTKELGILQINSQLELGAIAGRYDPSFFSGCDTLALIAGGSGVTPFIRIADFLRKRSSTYPVSRVLLLFFNHSEQDIIWKSEWMKFAETWNVFHFFPVISTPDATWTGLTGRVDNVQLFESILQQTVEASGPQPGKIDASQFGKFKAMICGSSGFNEAFVTMLKSQTIVKASTNDEDLFIF